MDKEIDLTFSIMSIHRLEMLNLLLFSSMLRQLAVNF